MYTMVYLISSKTGLHRDPQKQAKQTKTNPNKNKKRKNLKNQKKPKKQFHSEPSSLMSMNELHNTIPHFFFFSSHPCCPWFFDATLGWGVVASLLSILRSCTFLSPQHSNPSVLKHPDALSSSMSILAWIPDLSLLFSSYRLTGSSCLVKGWIPSSWK